MQENKPESIRSYSLYELVGSVRRCLEASFSGRYWVRAETSDLRRAGGHTYLELLEKDDGGSVRARVRAHVWAYTYASIEQRLREAGLASLTSGMSILALVQVAYHEQYGLSLNIVDLDPSYSLGEIARLRQETIARLKREHIFDDNKTLPLPRPLQRLAIVSSPTAAGLGDFMHQLSTNRYGLHFYTALFVAQMQGEHTTPSVIRALERVEQSLEAFDAVVIIRGGGAVSDLRAFDTYQLCSFCAQYPLPILCGIGHERDESVLDLVAHTSLKTPTAVAEYLIHRQLDELGRLSEQSQRLVQAVSLLSLERHRALAQLTLRLPHMAGRALQGEQRRQGELRQRLSTRARQRLEGSRQRLERIPPLVSYMVRGRMRHEQEALGRIATRLRLPLRAGVAHHVARLEQYEQAIRLAHPDNVLRRGFALVERAGRIVTQASDLAPGDRLRLRLGTGAIDATVD